MKKIYLNLLLIFASMPVLAERDIHYHFDFGTWFGGEKIADNPDGDNYNAGSGALFGLGLDWKFNDKYDLYFRNNLGLRYQGAKTGSGGNRGIVYESALVKQFGLINVGVGLHLDMAAVTKDFGGNRIEYDDSLGNYIAFEYYAFETWGFGVKYLSQEYKLSTNSIVSGDQFGLFLTGRF